MRDTDWSVLELDGVVDTAYRAAHTVATHPDYGPYVEEEDLRQEALLATAGMADDVRLAFSGEREDFTPGVIHHRVRMDLLNLVQRRVEHAQDTESYEERYTENEDGYQPRAGIVVRHDSPLYDRELVETLLPAVWDESYCYGMRAENAPDSDMPRGSTNKATGNTLAAHIADIKSGWKGAPLTKKEKVALLLSYGFDWSHKEIAFNQQCTRQTAAERIETAVGKIVAHLNDPDPFRHFAQRFIMGWSA